jgi:hypothetical protein
MDSESTLLTLATTISILLVTLWSHSPITVGMNNLLTIFSCLWKGSSSNKPPSLWNLLKTS